MTNKATFIKDLTGYGGAAKLYKCKPPLEGNDFVIVSAARVPYSGPETYIFPSDNEGNVTDYGELEGSYRGGLDHHKALNNAGYKVN
jgi:hypothetical protein